MGRASHIRPPRRLPAALLALCLLCPMAAAPAAAGPQRQPSHRPPPPAAVPTPAAVAAADSADSASAALAVPASGVRDPLLELLFTIAENDSLGTWNAAAVARYVAATGRTSRLPVADIVRITRRPATPAEAERRRGAVVTRIWELDLAHPVREPLPYSFLGYHPGTLSASGSFVCSEWSLENQTLHVIDDNRLAAFPVTGLRVLRLDSGWFTLDVDAWLDALLGGLLDDYWASGFVFARYEGRPLEVSLLLSRDGEDDYGEFDLGHDRIVAHPEAVARGLSRLARPWMAPSPGSKRVPWRVETAGGRAP